ncbi:MAG: hypothetical protein A3F70_03930 [Acidobacteria bacterium RIFCSPLOWO2_12_FULL_67_14]|nr:MAG: hypothetical protein A3H29_14520 [Acidobacteria bacterium RIFCSPLOWO2_02_FULL_67_21]OFW35370.1 MAG: hypothetical protein A3F70_03930 [Acidobacteria bacterium RIFCSPLOWO2_12_FULL_67_14]
MQASQFLPTLRKRHPRTYRLQTQRTKPRVYGLVRMIRGAPGGLERSPEIRPITLQLFIPRQISLKPLLLQDRIPQSLRRNRNRKIGRTPK